MFSSPLSPAHTRIGHWEMGSAGSVSLMMSWGRSLAPQSALLKLLWELGDESVFYCYLPTVEQLLSNRLSVLLVWHFPSPTATGIKHCLGLFFFFCLNLLIVQVAGFSSTLVELCGSIKKIHGPHLCVVPQVPISLERCIILSIFQSVLMFHFFIVVKYAYHKIII